MDNNDYKNEFYKRLYRHSLDIVKFTDKLLNNQSTRVLGDQLLRSGTSVCANLVEAKSASSKRDYINFYSHALKSANESKFWIALLKDADKIDGNSADILLKETNEIANILAKSIMTMKGKNKF